MDNKISTIKDRVLQIAKYHSVSYELFCGNIGMTYGSFKGSAKKTPLNSDAIANILTNYPNISPDWLLTGRGEMLRAADGESTTVQVEPTVIYRDNPKDVEIMQLLREQNAQLKEQIAELKKPKFCGVPINMSNTPPAEPSPPAVAESKPISSKPPKKTSIKSEIHT